MKGILFYIVWGYLSGSVLFAQVFARAFGKKGMIENSKDQNPGTANAFLQGGFWCGLLTLVGDVLKGFLPVFCFLHDRVPETPFTLLNALVIAAPVIGHVFPVFFGFKGGKGIAVTFGCLLGLLPVWQPLAAMAAFFLFFSLVLRITPHYHRTLAAYLCSLGAVLCATEPETIKAGFLIITVTVFLRMLASKEVKEKMGVKLLWTH